MYNKQTIFYSRNPDNLHKDLNLGDITIVDTIVLDYEFKKKINIADLAKNVKSFIQYPNLKTLFYNFGGCNFNNQAIKSILESHKQFQNKIKSLHLILDNNLEITKDGFIDISRFLINCPSLNNLSLSLRKCALNATSVTSLLNELKNMELKVLTLNFDTNKIEYEAKFGESIKNLFSKSKHCLRYAEIIFANNQLGDKGAGDVAASLQGLSSLTCLLINLVKNNITDAGIKVFSSSLAKFQYLNFLHLCFDSNTITENGIKELSIAIESLLTIVHLNLDLDYNKIGKEGARLLFEQIYKLDCLQSLAINIAHNQFGDEGAQYIADNISNLSSLKSLKLELGWNNIGPLGSLSISEQICKLGKQLISLQLFIDNNPLKEEGVNHLSDMLANFNGLKKLVVDFDDVGMSLSSAKKLNDAIKKITSLGLFLLNITKNEVQSSDLQNLLNDMKKVFSRMQMEGYMYKFGANRNLRALHSASMKVQSAAGLASYIQRVCEVVRELIPLEDSAIILSLRGYASNYEEYLKPEQLSLIFSDTMELNAEFWRNFISLNDSHDDMNQINLLDNSQNDGNGRGNKASNQKDPMMNTQYSGNSANSGGNDMAFSNISRIFPPQQNIGFNLGNHSANGLCLLLPYNMELQIQKQLGVGSFGPVYQVYAGGKVMAYKQIELDLIKTKNAMRDLQTLYMQVNTLVGSMDHKGVFPLVGMSFDVNEQGIMTSNIFMPIGQTNLYQYVKDRTSIDTLQCLKIAKDILITLSYFQRNMIIHAGIKPSNILFMDFEYKHPLISDLGIAKLAKWLTIEGESTSVHGFAPKYSAPEIFDGQTNKYTDTWSFGCLLLHLFTGEVPWSGISEYQQVKVMAQKQTILQHYKQSSGGEIKKNILPPQIESLIEKCCNYESRISPEDLLSIYPDSLK